MSVYVVTWDLNKEKPNYADARAKFLARVGQYENTRDAGLDSVRFVSTTQSADQLSDSLRPALDGNDRIGVTKLVNGGHQGWLSKEVWDWINARV